MTFSSPLSHCSSLPSCILSRTMWGKWTAHSCGNPAGSAGVKRQATSASYPDSGVRVPTFVRLGDRMEHCTPLGLSHSWSLHSCRSHFRDLSLRSVTLAGCLPVSQDVGLMFGACLECRALCPHPSSGAVLMGLSLVSGVAQVTWPNCIHSSQSSMTWRMQGASRGQYGPVGCGEEQSRPQALLSPWPVPKTLELSANLA